MDVAGLIGWVREYARERIDSRLIDERRSIPPHVVLDFGNRGLLGMQVSREYGGLGLRYADPDGHLARWVEQEFEDRCARLPDTVEKRSRAVSVPLEEILEQSRDFVEQHLPGEETALDDILRRQDARAATRGG